MGLPRCLTRAQARAYDQWCMRDGGHAGITLMEHAAVGIAAHARTLFAQSARDGRIEIVVGAGNNGGDGYGCARLLAEDGFAVVVICTEPPEPGSDASLAKARLERTPVPIVSLADSPSWAREGPPALVVDAVLGTGFDATRPLRETHRPLIERALRAAHLGLPVLAVDVPSGLDADTGTPADPACCIRATLTVTMVAPKCGMLAESARPFVGDIVAVPIVPPGGAEPPLHAYLRA